MKERQSDADDDQVPVMTSDVYLVTDIACIIVGYLNLLLKQETKMVSPTHLYKCAGFAIASILRNMRELDIDMAIRRT